MALESEGQGAFGLADILFVTTFTGNAVNKIGAFAAHVEFASKGLFCHGTGD